MGWFFNTKKDKEDDTEARLNFSKKLQAVTNKIHATDNVDEIMLDLSAEICDLFHCDRLTLYAVSKDKGFIFSKLKTGLNTNKDLVLPINPQSVAGYVALTKKSVRIQDVYDVAELKTFSPELGFCRVVDEVTGYRTKQMLAAPLANARTRELLGVIQLLNNRADGAFTESAEVGLEELCQTMAIAFAQRMKETVPPRPRYQSLVTSAVISGPEFELAVRSAQRKNLDLEDVLVDEFQIQLAVIGESLAKTFNMPYESYKEYRRKPAEYLDKLKRDFVEKNQWVPIEGDQSSLTVLTTDPEHVSSARIIKEMFPYSTLFYRVTTKREFRQTVDQFFG